MEIVDCHEEKEKGTHEQRRGWRKIKIERRRKERKYKNRGKRQEREENKEMKIKGNRSKEREIKKE
jgi:hypothetical protein